MKLTIQVDLREARGTYDHEAHWNELFTQLTTRLPGLIELAKGAVVLQTTKVVPKIRKERKV